MTFPPDWLTLGTAASSSSRPATSPPSSEAQQQQQLSPRPMASAVSTHPSLGPLSRINKRPRVPRAGPRPKFDEARSRARAHGMQKKIERAEWNRLHPGLPPPVRLLTSAEMYEIGLTPIGNRMDLLQYLEEQKMGKEAGSNSASRQQRQQQLKKPPITKRFLPLIKEPPSGKAMLIRKQADLNKLLEDEKLLTTSHRTSSRAPDPYRPKSLSSTDFDEHAGGNAALGRQ